MHVERLPTRRLPFSWFDRLSMPARGTPAPPLRRRFTRLYRGGATNPLHIFHACEGWWFRGSWKCIHPVVVAWWRTWGRDSHREGVREACRHRTGPMAKSEVVPMLNAFIQGTLVKGEVRQGQECEALCSTCTPLPTDPLSDARLALPNAVSVLQGWHRGSG
jgi:hypothetical protein